MALVNNIKNVHYWVIYVTFSWKHNTKYHFVEVSHMECNEWKRAYIGLWCSREEKVVFVVSYTTTEHCYFVCGRGKTQLFRWLYLIEIFRMSIGFRSYYSWAIRRLLFLYLALLKLIGLPYQVATREDSVHHSDPRSIWRIGFLSRVSNVGCTESSVNESDFSLSRF